MSIDVAWDPKFEIGHTRIDAEHRMLFDLIAAMAAQLECMASPQRVAKSLREIYKFADFHFVSEENLMDDLRYPELAEHRHQHEVLLAELRDLMVGLHIETKQPGAVIRFLVQWLTVHVAREDRRIVEFMSAAELETSGS